MSISGHEKMTVGDVFRLFKQIPEKRKLVEECYYDENVLTAARRFYASEEFSAVLRLFNRYWHSRLPSLVLDLGGGNGVASLAWEWAGHKVVLVEPDSDDLVGWGAIVSYVRQGISNIQICAAIGEELPFADRTFDVVYVRQVLHHATDLNRFCFEVHRVLKPKGLFIATREHVISKPSDLEVFLQNHPVHPYTGGENAFMVRDYYCALKRAGFRHIKILGPWQSVINYYPMSKSQFIDRCYQALSKRMGRRLGKSLADKQVIQRLLGWYWTRKDRTPGRLHSFIAIRES